MKMFEYLYLYVGTPETCFISVYKKDSELGYKFVEVRRAL